MTTHSRSALFHLLGGPVTVRQIIDDFYRRMLEDPELAPHFAGADLRQLRRHQFQLLATAMGGLASELARLPTTEAIGFALGDEHFDRALAHLDDALEAFGTDPEIADEVLGILTSLYPAIATT
jgi:hemoglobin